MYLYRGTSKFQHMVKSLGPDFVRAGHLPLDSFDSFGKRSCTNKVMDSG